MSYMNSNLAFTPAGGIEDLSFDEVDSVVGGVAWVAIPIAVGIALLASEIYHHHIEKK